MGQKLLRNYLQQGPEGSFQEVVIYQNLLLRPVTKTQIRKLPGNYLQESPEGSFQEEAKYQHLYTPVAKNQIRKLLGNYLQEGPEGSFPEVAHVSKLTPCSTQSSQEASRWFLGSDRGAFKVVSKNDGEHLRWACPL